MKKLNKTFVIICLGLGMILGNVAYGTHIAGGEITYKCVGKDSFLVTLSFYRDCNGMLEASQVISARCGATGTIIKSVTCSKPTPIDITPVCGSACTRCQSSGCSFPYGIEKYVYTGLINLSNAGSCCEIIFSHSLCCRTGTITTGSAGADYYIEARLNRCLSPFDNSPVFVNDPLLILCIGKDFTYNHFAFDSDMDSKGNLLDSLSYSIVQPLLNATSPVVYNGQYSYDKPIFFWGFPNTNLPFPRGFHLDTHSGELSFRPMKIEQTVIAIKVTSWRKINGVRTKISEITRDIQYIVISCPNNNVPTINASLPSVINEDKSFTISTNDIDTKDTLKLEIISNIPDFTYQIDTGQIQKPGARINFNNVKDHASNLPYFLSIKVQDNVCPFAESTSKTYLIKYTAFPDKFIIKDSVVGCNLHYLTIIDSPNYNFDYSWVIADKNPIVRYGKDITYYSGGPGIYPFDIQIKGGIFTLLHDTIKQDSLLFLNPITDKGICEGDSILIEPLVEFAHGKLDYLWSNGDTLSFLKFSPHQDTIIYLKISDTASCVAYDTFEINVKKPAPIKVDMGADKYPCFNETVTLKPKIVNDLLDQYLFDFYSLGTNQLLAKAQKSVVVSSGSFFADISNDTFCALKDTVFVYPFLQIKAYTPDQSVCPYENVTLIADSTGSKNAATIYEWYDQGDSMLLAIGQSMSTIADVNKVFKLLVKEWHTNKYCKDEIYVKLNREKTFFNPLFRGGLCTYDSFIDMNAQIDTTLGNIFSTHPSFLDGRYYNPNISGLSTDSILIRLSDFYSGCEYDTLYIFNNYLLPIINISNQFQKTSFCPEYGLIQLYASPSGGKYGGIWHGPVEQNMYFNTSRTPGNYTLVYEYRDNNGCINSDSVVLTVGHTAIAIDKSDSMICSGNRFQAKATFSFAQKMQWIYGSGSDGFMNGSIYNAQNTYISGAGDKLNKGFTLYAKTIDPVCPEMWDSIHVYIAAQPKADFSTDMLTGNPPLNVQFSDQTNIAYDYISDYLWDFGDGNKSTLKDPQHTYTDSGYYGVHLKVTSDQGCADSIHKNKLIYVYSVSMEENQISNIKIYPNPANDQLTIESSENLDKVILYNFLGAKIREMDINENRVTLNRDKLPSGLYLLKVFDIKGKVYVYQVVFK